LAEAKKYFLRQIFSQLFVAEVFDKKSEHLVSVRIKYPFEVHVRDCNLYLYAVLYLRMCAECRFEHSEKGPVSFLEILTRSGLPHSVLSNTSIIQLLFHHTRTRSILPPMGTRIHNPGIAKGIKNKQNF